MASLYWTGRADAPTVGFPLQTLMKPLLPALLLALSAGTAAAQVAGGVVSADAAAEAMVRGAAVIDVRPAAQYLAGHLPGAVSVPAAAAVQQREELQAMVSARGVDLSREVLVVGLPGDAAAQKLAARLGEYASGQVNWLVGGVHEWVMSGRPVTTVQKARAPVPQYLVAFRAGQAQPRMAAAGLRDAGATTGIPVSLAQPAL
jgi:3-mercaptopyruvate sulfurtransferase SseA